MKIKNIFFAAILVLAGFSCSMEDDVIMNDVEKGIEEATEAYAVLDFGVTFKEMSTKTSVGSGDDLEANEAERHMSDVSIFLYEEGKLIEILKAERQDVTLVAEGSSETTDNNPLENLKYVTKYKAGRTLAAHVVVNAGQFLDGITFGTSEIELNKTVSGCLSATNLIKSGTKDIVFGDGKDVTTHYVSPSEAEQNPNTILVTVSQIAARLDFSEFSVTLEDFENNSVVTLEEAKFVNLQQDGKIVEGYADSKVADGVSLDRSNSRNQEGSTVWTGVGTAYGYANQYRQASDTNTALYVKFTVDGRTFEKTYPINPDNINKEVDHNGIKGGYLYDIKVRWTITPRWGDSVIEFYTKDWVHNTIPEVVL